MASVMPSIQQPSQQGDLVGLVLQNTGQQALAAAPVTFGQVFKAGAVTDGTSLVLRIGNKDVPVQVDVKTHHADGSVAMAILSFEEPVIPSGTSRQAMLAVSSTASQAPAVDLASALKNYDLSTDLTIHDAGGGTTSHHIDIDAAMKDALAKGTASFWLHGATATQARVDIGVAGSLHVVADITAYADGTLRTTISFNNDLAMGQVGGAVTYAAKVTENGATVLNQAELKQFQYQNWHVTLHEDEKASVNLQHDIAYLQSAGAIPNFDLSGGVSANYSAGIQATMNSSSWDDPLTSNGIFQYMPNTGGRPDIGVTTLANWAWLATQDAQTAKYALGQADAAAGIPWHFKDVATGTWLSTDVHPSIWTDFRGGSGLSTTGLTQQVDMNNTGWTPDAAHQPDLSAIPYLLTGNRTYLDDLNAQASYDIVSSWPEPRGNDADILLPSNQIRGAAWSLREIAEAAALNPDGSAEKAYYQSVVNENWAWLVKQLPTWTQEQGEVYGRLANSYEGHTYHGQVMSPWQEDFLAIEAAEAALDGNADARTFLEWKANWTVGRFLHEADGFNPHDGVNYSVVLHDASGTLLTSWKSIGDAMVANGSTNGAGWWQSDGYYAQVAAAAVAGVVSVTHTMDSERAYGWLMSSGAPYVSGGVDAQFDMAPRLTDGTLLTSDKLILSSATANMTLTGTSGSELIHAGSGNDIVLGLGGNDLLFAGAGNDTLFGGAGNDDLFGGTGNTVLMGGIGNNRLDGGSGADTFVFRVGDDGHDTITNFNPGTDSLRLVNAAGVDISSTQAQAILKAATHDAAGNLVLHLSAQQDVTIVGVADASVSIARGATIDLSQENGGVTAPPTPPPTPSPTPNPTSTTIMGTDGNDTLGVLGTGQANRMIGGRGDDYYLVDSAKDVVIEAADGGSDTVTVSIDGGTYRLPANVENLTLTGSTAVGIGNSLDNVLSAGANPGSQLLKGGAGNDTLIAGVGPDVLHGGAGNDLFIFTAGMGGGKVLDFKPGTDTLLIGGANLHSMADLQAASTESKGSTFIHLSNGDTIQLAGVTLASLHASDFIW